jgi:hypothetical protein
VVGPRFVRRIRAATRLPDEARLDAFARLDADVARAAILAPFATSTTTDFFSDRIGCQVHQPIYGISPRRAVPPALTARRGRGRRYFAREASQAPHFSLFSKLCPVSPCSLSRRRVASSRGA